MKQRRYAEAIAEREKVVELSERSGPQLSGLGCVYAVAGRRAEALAILKELEEKYARREIIGQILAGCIRAGRQRQGLRLARKDFEERSAELQHINYRVQLEQLRHEPRGIDLIRRMGLKP